MCVCDLHIFQNTFRISDILHKFQISHVLSQKNLVPMVPGETGLVCLRLSTACVLTSEPLYFSRYALMQLLSTHFNVA